MKFCFKALILLLAFCVASSCTRKPKQVVFEISENVAGLLLLVDKVESPLKFQTKSDTYHLTINESGVSEVRELETLNGYIELTAFLGGETIPVGLLFFTKPVGTSMLEGDLHFDKSHGGRPEEKKAIWKYSPSSIMNGVRTYAFFVGTLEDAKLALNEMRDSLVDATKEYGKNVLLSPEEFERRQRENPVF